MWIDILKDAQERNRHLRGFACLLAMIGGDEFVGEISAEQLDDVELLGSFLAHRQNEGIERVAGGPLPEVPEGTLIFTGDDLQSMVKFYTPCDDVHEHLAHLRTLGVIDHDIVDTEASRHRRQKLLIFCFPDFCFSFIRFLQEVTLWTRRKNALCVGKPFAWSYRA